MGLERWTSEPFLAAAEAWTAQALTRYGGRLTGPGEQPHARPWSSVIRYPSSLGTVWFKVNGPGTAHEPALVELLARRVPDLVPQTLAADVERGWSLTRDAGPTLREVMSPREAWAVWPALVVRYAEAQLGLVAEREAVLACGVRDASPRRLPEQARALARRLGERPVEEGGLDDRQADRLEAAWPALESWCQELDEASLPDSLQHDDLHSANVCWPGAAATARVIDWGDSVWTVPLATLLGTTASLAHHAGLPTDAPEVVRVRDAYLEVFSGYGDRAALLRLTDLAMRTGCVTKALSWEAALSDVPPAEAARREHPYREWLLDLAEVRPD